MNTENDRELLELAAKAAGSWIVGPVEKYIVQFGHYENGFVIRNDRGGDSCWNPIADDGDALRLAVKLRVDLIRDFDRIDVVYDEGSVSEYLYELPTPTDPYAATRRAIVRAAAAIGKEM